MSLEWLREAESNDQVVQLYLELKVLQCQVGGISYQDVIFDPRVGINIISKSLVIDSLLKESFHSLRNVSSGSPVKFWRLREFLGSLVQRLESGGSS
jgi:hypothetical protein